MHCSFSKIFPEALARTPSGTKYLIRLGKYLATGKAPETPLFQSEDYLFVS